MESSKKIPKKQVVLPAKADIGLGNVDNTSDVNKPVSVAQQAALDGKQSVSEKNQPDGYVGLDSNNKINSVHFPAIAITDTFIVESESEMLGLTVEKGDVAVRLDLSKSFILKGNDPTEISDWAELLSPTSDFSLRNIYCQDGLETTLITIEDPNSCIDLTAKIGHGTKYFITKLSVIVDWNALTYTYKIKNTNTTGSDDYNSINVEFILDFAGAGFVVKLSNYTGSDIYANINANIL